MSEEFLNILRKEFEEIASKSIKKYMKNNNYERPYDGKVVSVSEDGLSCGVDLGFTTLSSVRNMTGETLAAGNGVTVYARGGNINNAYVGLKLY